MFITLVHYPSGDNHFLLWIFFTTVMKIFLRSDRLSKLLTSENFECEDKKQNQNRGKKVLIA